MEEWLPGNHPVNIRNGRYRKRQGEILFIDGRKLGALIPGSRKQKQLSEDELEKIASV